MKKIFDFHTHCYVPPLAEKAVALLPKGSPYGPFYDATLEGLISSMAKNKIDAALAMHISSSPKSTVSVNDWAVECQKRDNIYAFGSVHPLFDGYKAEIKRLKQNGIKGLKFHPYYQKYYATDKAAYPVYQAAADEGMIMVFHCGYDLMLAGDYCLAKDFNKIIRDFSGAQIVGAHLGGWNDFDSAFNLFLGKDIYLDTSFAFSFLSHEMRLRLIENHPAEKLLFGTDSPWMDAKQEIELLNSYLNEKKSDLIFYKNAEKLLDIKI